MANALLGNIQLKGKSTNESDSLRVLLVEDSPLQQLWVSHILKQHGHAVSVASDGFGALSAIELDRRYDVILMDCQMPLMDGFQATKFIREKEQITGRRIAIIGISATATPEQCAMAGMDAFLAKPLNQLNLQATLKRAIRLNTVALMRSPLRSIGLRTEPSTLPASFKVINRFPHWIDPAPSDNLSRLS